MYSKWHCSFETPKPSLRDTLPSARQYVFYLPKSYQLGAKYSPVQDLWGISYETTIPMGPGDLPTLGLQACFPEPGFLFSVYVNSRGQTWVLKLVQQARYWLSCSPCPVWFSIDSECTVFHQFVKPGTAVHKVVQGNSYMGLIEGKLAASEMMAEPCFWQIWCRTRQQI